MKINTRSILLILSVIIFILTQSLFSNEKEILIGGQRIKIAASIVSENGEYEIANPFIKNTKTIENSIYIIKKDLVLGPFKANGRLNRSFLLNDQDKLYVEVHPSMSHRTLLEISIKQKKITREFEAISIIEINKKAGWIAYNDHNPNIHGVNPGDDQEAFAFYNGEEPPFHDPPPLGAFIYFQSKNKIEDLFIAKASSVLVENKKDPDALGASKTLDGKISTAWSEGVSGEGKDQWIEYVPKVPIMIKNIRVWGSYGKSIDLIKNNSSPAKLKVEINGDEIGEVKFEALSPYYGIWSYSEDRNKRISAEIIRLTIIEVKQGAKWKDNCISEVEFW